MREILRYGEEIGADLILLSSHRVDLSHPSESLATISYQIAVLSPSSVLLVK